MRDPIRVVVLGTGQMGCGIARLVLEKKGLTLAGAFARRSRRGGIDLGRAIGLEKDLGLAISNDLQALVAEARPDIAIQATCSRLAEASGEIAVLLRHGVNVISIAEEMSYPACASAVTTAALTRLAIDHDAAVLGTGINPGFVLDLLVIALSGVCSRIDSITAERINDLSPYGPSVLEAQGVGLSPEAFRQGVTDGTVAGHVGFRESLHMIADTVGWDLEHIEETREPIVSKTRRKTPFVTVEPGQVAGCHHTAAAHCGGRPVITLVHPQQVHPHLDGVMTGDSITISGEPAVHFSGTPEIPGGGGTIALAVNMIPRVLGARPGLYSMADLPVPAAMLGDVRWRRRRDREMMKHGRTD